jgi:putative ABC transport system substrate-binding protein
VNDARAAAPTYGQQIKVFDVRSDRDIESAFASLAQTRADALMVATSPLFRVNANQIVGLAARHAIPTIYFRRDFAVAGGW